MQVYLVHNTLNTEITQATQGAATMKYVRKTMSEAEASVYLGVSRIALRQGRSNGRRDNRMPPPPYIKLGRKILYLVEDLDAWLLTYRVEL